MVNGKQTELLQRGQKIRLLLTDCDGVLTDSGVYYGENGEALKRFSIRDGMGVERLRTLAGIETGIVTGEKSPSVIHRAEKLKIALLYTGIRDKAPVLQDILRQQDLDRSQVAYIGDDVNDLEVLDQVGLAACPQDAMPEVQSICHFVSRHPGGHGAFRDLAELIIAAKLSIPT